MKLILSNNTELRIKNVNRGIMSNNGTSTDTIMIAFADGVTLEEVSAAVTDETVSTIKIDRGEDFDVITFEGYSLQGVSESINSTDVMISANLRKEASK